MIKYITYKKKEYPIRISYRIQKKLQELNKARGSEEIGVDVYEEILYEALRSGAHATDDDFNFTMEDMEFILDECFEEFKEMFNFFVDKMKADADKLDVPGEVPQPQRPEKSKAK